MIQSNINHIEELIAEIRPLITNNRIKELFTTRPKIEMDVYKKTAIFSAFKEYEGLDEKDPISSAYNLEVSSCGLERHLREIKHFEWAVGKNISIKLYKAVDKKTRML